MQTILKAIEAYGWIKLIVDLLTPAAILIAFFTYKLSRKRHYFDAVQACWKRYLNIVRQQQQLDLERDKMTEALFVKKHLILFRDHMGLVCEEISYIRQGMLPRDVAKAWLYEMAKRVPYWQHQQWANRKQLKAGDNKRLAYEFEKQLFKTYQSFDGLRVLFSDDFGDGKYFDFSKDCCDWDEERKRFAEIMYRRVRPSRWRSFVGWLKRKCRAQNS